MVTKISIKVFLIVSNFLCILPSTWSLRTNDKKEEYRQYNEKCVLYDNTASCQSSQGLMCLDTGLRGYRCLCPANKLHAQYYDPKQNSCVGKAFNACVRGNSRTNFNETLCVENAECNTATYGLPICMCKEGFVEKDDGTCIASLRYGDTCEITTNTEKDEPVQEARNSRSYLPVPRATERKSAPQICDERLGLACIDGTCQCRYSDKEQYYDPLKEKCVSQVDGRCSFDGQEFPCVEHAHCPLSHSSKVKPHPFVPPSPPLPPFLEDLAGAMDREDVYVVPMHPPKIPPHIAAHLNPPYNMHHHHAGHHRPPLSRQDTMFFDTITTFDDYRKRSFKFGASKLDQDGDVVEAEEPRCQCIPGYSKTAQGKCMKGHGTQCTPDDNLKIYLDLGRQNSTSKMKVEDDHRDICNPDEYLDCLDAHDGSFKCQCRNQMNERYDPIKKQCVAIVGRKCRPAGNYPKCEKGSECISGMCQCPEGTSLTPTETCLKDFEERCEPGDCNVWKGLICHAKSRTCLCLDSFLRWDPTRKLCLASKGATCGAVVATTSWSPSHVPDTAIVECDLGLECKAENDVIGGKTVPVGKCSAKQ